MCEGCLTGARETLAGVFAMWQELPRHLGNLTGSLGRSGPRAAADGRPLPGGDVLVLLGPGSEGLSEDELTSKTGDATSLAFELGWWEDEWRSRRKEPAPRPTYLAAAVRRSCGYLEVHARWAADHHEGFEDFTSDLQILHSRLERATGRAREAARANAQCFDCQGDLVRLIDAEGLEEQDVTCRRCHRRYTAAEYSLALRAARDSGLQGWVPVRDAAVAAKRSVETLESWVKRGLVEVACRISDRRHLVWWPDIEARAARAQKRKAS